MGYCNKATGNAVYKVYGNVDHFLFDERHRLLPREAWKDCPDIHLAIAFVPRICYNVATNLQGGIMVRQAKLNSNLRNERSSR
jgi:hypothetical protein